MAEDQGKGKEKFDFTREGEQQDTSKGAQPKRRLPGWCYQS